MEEKIRPFLEKGEKLLWCSRPEAFETLDATHKKPFIRGTVISAAAALIITALYVFLAKKNGAPIMPLLIAVILVAAALGPIHTFTYASKLRDKTIYAATDHRLIILSNDLKSADYEGIKAAAFKKDSDGHATLLCGEDALKFEPRKWRIAALFPTFDNEAKGGPVVDRFAFYAVDNSELLSSILSPYVKLQ